MRTAIKKLRELAQGCPACMLAALRQKGAYTDDEIFDFKAEMKAAFDGAIKAKRDDERYFD